jgi:uncharacterized protein (TIGR03089 family)
MAARTPESLFQARMAGAPANPFVTFYDDDTGERAELSARSLANWVAKTNFLLTDELGLGPGDRAFVGLPPHWLAAPVLLGCWFAGLEVVSEPVDAEVYFGDAERLVAAGAAIEDPGRAYAVSLLSMARSAAPPPGMHDYADAVRPQPDAWATVRAQAGPDSPAVNGLSRTAVAERAAAVADGLGLGPSGRLLWTHNDFGPDDWIAAVLAPLSVGGSLVLVRNGAGDPSVLERRAAAERVTVTA